MHPGHWDSLAIHKGVIQDKMTSGLGSNKEFNKRMLHVLDNNSWQLPGEITNTVRTGVLTRWQCDSSFLREERIGKLALEDRMLALVWQEKETQNLQDVLFLLGLVGIQGDKIRRRHRNVINVAPC